MSEKNKQDGQGSGNPVILNTLADFQSTLNLPLHCELEVAGQRVSVACRRLPTAQQREIDRLWDPRALQWQLASTQCTPPRRKDAEGKDYYDVEDKEYRWSLEQAKAQAKALTVYHGVPMVHDAKPDLKGVAEIQGYVEGLFSQVIIELLYSTIVGEGLGGMLDRANFTGTSDSLEN